tara:strand:+ start:533 stop:913 length:381 start_codon:yes stop_codon:yes gene_type:complete
MGGGSPSVQGGMTEEQYRSLLQEEREFQQQQEERYRERLMEMEQQRIEMEAEQTQAIQAAEASAQDVMQEQEALLTAEILSQEQEEATGAGQTGDPLEVDFYGSLTEGVMGDDEGEGPFDPDTQPL